MAALYIGPTVYHPTMTSSPPMSKLMLMQAKFQQKQLEEREQKLLALYEEQSQAYRINQGGGKVRQLFQERRTHQQPGLDRSYPLEPIYDNRREARGRSLDRNQNTNWKNQQPQRSKSQIRKYPLQTDDNHLYNSRNNSDEPVLDKSFRNQPYLFGDENDYFTEVKNNLDTSSVFKKLPNIGGSTLANENPLKKDLGTRVPDYQNNMSPAKESVLKKPTPTATKVNVSSLTKSISKMTTNNKVTEVNPPVAANSTKSIKSTLNNNKRIISPPSSGSSSRPASNTTIKEPVMSTKLMKPATKPAPKLAARRPSSSSTTGLASCKICSRNFAPDRVKAHEEICAKTSRKKRKAFDPVKQRLKGTEAEPYLRRGKPQPPPLPNKSNWRKKHEDFINNIRAAKVAQAHVARGGKLTDLPPPPPMDTSDLIPCPHCGRKFNDAAAERHIPKCATMLHNKPKPAVKNAPVKRRY
uniref:C2HC/C3H-type domain-containing protein n=1 Tax=Clastoptera arizonana TaxID=38151 RepID=A0A1B6D4S2_9HEMI